MVVTATDDTVQGARQKVYRRMDRIKKSMPGSPMFRTDIGLRLSKQLSDLNRMGYARDLIFSPQQSS
jgi:phosphoribosylamine-glycine ligase